MGAPRTYTFLTGDGDARQRLDRFLGERMDGVSRQRIKNAIQEGRCRVQGRTADSPATRLGAGQTVELRLAPVETAVRAEDGDVQLVWHDDDLVVLDKPAGLTVHPCPSCPEGTLVHRLVGRFPVLAQQSGLRPGIVHRLDKDTSGLLVVALTEAARLTLSEDFAAHAIHKEYLALVHGVPPIAGESREPVGRHPSIKIKMAVVPENRGGRPAHSAWRVLYAAPDRRFSLLAVRIFTGRTHQIRVHMAHLGHPLWGDALYGLREHLPGIRRQMLHAWKLRFSHPRTGEALAFVCPPPPDMRQAVLTLAHRMQRVVVTGSPGCGKSSLTRRLGQRGIPTWSADDVVRRLYAPEADGWLFLRGRFGDRFMTGDDPPQVRRPALLEAMRRQPELRREVEQTVHALARCDLEKFWDRAEASGAPLAVAEVPLYLETRWNVAASKDAGGTVPEAPVLVGVSCPLAERHARLAATRGWSAETSATLESWQWPETRKLAACALIVDNSADETALDNAVTPLLRRLEDLRADGQERLAKDVAARCAE